MVRSPSNCIFIYFNITAVRLEGDLLWVDFRPGITFIVIQICDWLPPPSFQNIIIIVVGCILIWQLHSLYPGLHYHLSHNLHWKKWHTHTQTHTVSSTNSKNLEFLLQGKLKGTFDAFWLSGYVNLLFVSVCLIHFDSAKCSMWNII